MTIAEFPLQSGGVVLVRVEGDYLDGQVLRGGHATGVLDRAQTTFEAALGTVRVVAQGVLGQLTGLPRVPDEVHVEFGLELQRESGCDFSRGWYHCAADRRADLAPRTDGACANGTAGASDGRTTRGVGRLRSPNGAGLGDKAPDHAITPAGPTSASHLAPA